MNILPKNENIFNRRYIQSIPTRLVSFLFEFLNEVRFIFLRLADPVCVPLTIENPNTLSSSIWLFQKRIKTMKGGH